MWLCNYACYLFTSIPGQKPVGALLKKWAKQSIQAAYVS